MAVEKITIIYITNFPTFIKYITLIMVLINVIACSSNIL